MTRRGLGRGLDDLISSDALQRGATLVELRPHEIEPNPFQPRTRIDPEELESLTRSIELHGILQPLVVRRQGSGYQLITGERRWRAAQRASLKTVPCLVREIEDADALQIALVENLQREDLNAVDAALGYLSLAERFHLTHDEIAERLGRSRTAVVNTLRILDLPEAVRDQVRTGELTEGHGRALLGLSKDPNKLSALAQKVVEGRLSVRETERLVREHPARTAQTPRRQVESKDPNLEDSEDQLRRALGTKVEIRPRRRGGTIQITYHDLEELQRIVDALVPRSRFGDLG